MNFDGLGYRLHKDEFRFRFQSRLTFGVPLGVSFLGVPALELALELIGESRRNMLTELTSS